MATPCPLCPTSCCPCLPNLPNCLTPAAPNFSSPSSKLPSPLQTLAMVDEVGAAGLLGMKLLDYGEGLLGRVFPVARRVDIELLDYGGPACAHPHSMLL